MSGGVYTTNLIKSLGSLTDVDSDNRQDGQAPVYNLSEDIYEHKTVLEPNTTEDIITTGDITCDTLNYTTLNPPVSSSSPTHTFLHAKYATPANFSGANVGGNLNNWTLEINPETFTTSGANIYFPSTGFYHINATINFLSLADNIYNTTFSLFKTGTRVTRSIRQPDSGTTGEQHRYVENTVNAIIEVGASDYIYFNFSANMASGSSSSITNENTTLTILKLK